MSGLGLDSQSSLLATSSSVASRFISSSAIEEAAAKREADRQASYARLNEAPPDLEAEQPYDGRSLWEKLQENKDKKQEAFDEALKFKNQFRALDEEEISFLDSLTDDTQEEEAQRKKLIQEEVESFRRAIHQKGTLVPTGQDSVTTHSSSASKFPKSSLPPKTSKVRSNLQKKMLSAVVLKRKQSAPNPNKSESSSGQSMDAKSKTDQAKS